MSALRCRKNQGKNGSAQFRVAPRRLTRPPWSGFALPSNGLSRLTTDNMHL